MEQLATHGCFACGSVPLEEGNHPNVMGVLRLDFVWEERCDGGPRTVVCETTRRGEGVGAGGGKVRNGTRPEWRTFPVREMVKPPGLVADQ